MRIAARVSTAMFLASAAALATAPLVCVRHSAPPPPEEPHVYCALQNVTLASPCTRPDDRLALSAGAPADRGIGAIETASGLRVRVLSPACGAGGHPTARDVARVAYVGWNARGETITNGVETGELPMRAVIPGFAEAVERMTPGERIRAWIPADLAYQGARGEKYAGGLVFDLQLISFAPDTHAP